MSDLLRYLPWLLTILAVIILLILMVPPQDAAGHPQIQEFGKLAVCHHGRVKPLDTLARSSLLVISGRQTYQDKAGKTQPAIRWLLDLMVSDHDFEQRKVLSIQDPALLKYLELEPTGNNLYSLVDISKKEREVLRRTRQVNELEPRTINPLDKKIAMLAGEIVLYRLVTRYNTSTPVFRIENEQVQSLLGLEPRPGYRYAFTEFSRKFPKLLEEADRANEINPNERTVYDAKLVELMKQVSLYLGLARLNAETVLMVPPTTSDEKWRSIEQASNDSHVNGMPEPAVESLTKILVTYGDGDTVRFNDEVSKYAQLHEEWLSNTSRLRFETFFQNFAPFYQCALLYVVVFVLVCLSWIVWQGPLARSAFSLLVLALVVHTLAILARMYIELRPPVTNLYSSAVFIGWAGTILGLVLEIIYRNGIGLAVASALGFLTAVIAHHLASGGDTLEVMRAVLDTNFWLATHVTCITIGYSATFAAGLIGMIFIIRGVFTRSVDKQLFKDLGQMIYGVICFATFFSFTGTVLGGIWADQSWGRFWGWDPKENGALLIVLMNALVLHARWAGLVNQRGMAVLSLCGNVVTAWSWFGTNQLGVGLHAYGFNDTLAMFLVLFWISQLILIGFGLLPLKMWQSYALWGLRDQAAKSPQNNMPAPLTS